ncbi:MAG: segregation/condensation protein A [Clostridia bacterium]
MNYSVSIKQFEGPLDLLLHLIEKAEVDIKDIFVSEITSQYIDFIKQLDRYNIENNSEFITMAATLLFIKSRSMLPIKQEIIDEDDDPEFMLIERLKEYKAIKRATEELNEIKLKNAGRYTKLPEEFLLPPREIVLVNGSIELLHRAFSELLSRKIEEKAEFTHEVNLDRFTVREQLKKIREKLSDVLYITFFELFDDMTCKLEMIVTFMALLDMIVRNEIYVRQSAPFDEIKIIVRSLLTSDEDAKYMDEDID